MIHRLHVWLHANINPIALLLACVRARVRVCVLVCVRACSQEMFLDTGGMLAFDVRPVDMAMLKPDTRESHLVEVSVRHALWLY